MKKLDLNNHSNLNKYEHAYSKFVTFRYINHKFYLKLREKEMSEMNRLKMKK